MNGTQIESRFKVFEEIENALSGKVGERVLVVKRGVYHKKRAEDNVVVASWHTEEWFMGKLNAELLPTEPDCGIIFMPVDKYARSDFPFGKEEIECEIGTTPIRLNTFDDDGAIEMVIPPQETFDAGVRTASSRSIQVVISDEPIKSFVFHKSGRAAQLYINLNTCLFRDG